MKKLILLLAIFLLFFNSCTKKNTDNANNGSTDNVNYKRGADFLKTMYVTSKEGLRVRSEPCIDDNIIRTLSYGEEVIVYDKQKEPVTIDDITDYWYKIVALNEEWIFGGYLSEDITNDIIEDILTGLWDDVNNERRYVYFTPDNHRYMEGYKETDMGIWGKWEVNGNTVTLTLDSAGNGYVIDPPDIVKGQITVIDKINIQIQYPNEKEGGYYIDELKKNLKGW
jgi:hypothetical protein